MLLRTTEKFNKTSTLKKKDENDLNMFLGPKQLELHGYVCMVGNFKLFLYSFSFQPTSKFPGRLFWKAGSCCKPWISHQRWSRRPFQCGFKTHVHSQTLNVTTELSQWLFGARLAGLWWAHNTAFCQPFFIRINRRLTARFCRGCSFLVTHSVSSSLSN